MIVAETIKNERIKNGWSQEELAKKVMVTRQAVSKWELGESCPDIEKLVELSAIYKVSVDDLLKNNPAQRELSTTNKTTVNNIQRTSFVDIIKYVFLMILIMCIPYLIILIFTKTK